MIDSLPTNDRAFAILEPFAAHNFSEGHFQPLGTLTVYSFQIPQVFGLKTKF